MSFKLSATIWQEGEQYVSLCSELGISSCGENPEHALEMLQEAVELYLEVADDIRINLRGIWKGRGFEAITELDTELKTAREEMNDSIIQKTT
ncbi:MAG: hypothetical protein P9M15_05540 [Candidatus Electryoneaceae bacterium]|nr:hypothetical protein [Candidatus Electryoneaceae bacterium]